MNEAIMRVTRHIRWAPYLAAAVIAIATYATAPATQTAEASSCVLTAGNDGNWLGGYKQTGISGLDGSSAELWNYDPTTVHKASTFWTMVMEVDGTFLYWVQIGWMSWYQDDDDQSRVFMQLVDADSDFQWRYLKPDGSWSNNWVNSEDGVHPTSEDVYEIYTNGSDWNFVYDHNTADKYTFGRDFDPEEVQVYGEVLNYDTGNKGDHAPGDTSNKIQANLSKKNISGTWSNTSLGGGSAGGPFGRDLNNTGCSS
jgi:hypothetical protein